MTRSAFVELAESDRLTDRVAEALAALTEAQRTEAELSEWTVGLLLEDDQTIVQVDFVEDDRRLCRMRFDGASLGIHHVADEWVYIND